MLMDRRVVAVVPARAGSVGVPDKNMREVGGLSLIARTGRTLDECPWLDVKVLSTDAERYADEGQAHGLAVPFLRPAELSTSEARGIDVFRHAVQATEEALGIAFDVALLVEPTSPLRRAGDLEDACRLLLTSGAESVVTVSPLEARCHPWKILQVDGEGRLDFYAPEGRRIANRQELPGGLVARNGVCYAVTRQALFENDSLFTAATRALTIDRPIVNIDDELDLAVADLLVRRTEAGPRG